MKRSFSFSPARAALKLVCLALGLLLAVMITVTAGFHHLLTQVRTTASVSRPESFSQLMDVRQVNWQQLGTDLTAGSRKIVNILLVGQDRRENEGRTRADSMILCTFNKSTGELTMTSFLRDLYVPIPGRGKDRINAAYASGGMPLLKQTLTDNFGVQIHGAVEVDFSQFANVIDTLGGVEITLRQDEADLINRETGSSLTEGSQLLTGQQALAYSRIRSLDIDGDFSRTSRQRQVMTALVDAYKDAGFSSLLDVLRTVLPMISTDMSEPRLLMLALELFPMLSDIQVRSQRIPADGTYTDETINGMAVLSADLEQARKLLQATVSGD